MTVTSIVKAIHIKTGVTRIITVQELMESYPGHEQNIRTTLEHFGSLKMGDVIHHPVKGMPYIDLLGKSVMFDLKDEPGVLVKVQGIMFGDKLVGYDDQGQMVLIRFDEIDSYRLNGAGGNYFENL